VLGHRSQPLYPQDGTADLIRMMGFLMASIDNVCMCVCVCVCVWCVCACAPHHHVPVAKLTEPAEELVVK